MVSLGAPTGMTPAGRIRGSVPWADVNRWDALIVAAAAKHGVPASMLKAMMIVESGGQAGAADAYGAVGLMQIKPQYWGESARPLGYDLATPAGQIGMAAAILGGAVPWVAGTTPEERFLAAYYPIRGGLDAVGESGHTQRMYLEDIAAYRAIIDAASSPSPSPKPVPAPEVKPATLVFQATPHPPYQDRPIPKPAGNGWDDLGQRSVKGVVLHRMLGSLWGTDSYFRGPVGALTDYGVGVAATDGADKDGQLLRWNDPLGRRSGWASGPVSAPYGDGKAFVDRYGVIAVNRDLASIEISGQQDTPLSPGAFETVAALIAYWADQARVPWPTFPISPVTGMSFVFHHVEFTRGTGKLCPFRVVMEQTTPLIERAQAILRQYQGGGSGASPAPRPVPQASRVSKVPQASRVSKVPLPAGMTEADLRERFGPEFDGDGAVTVRWAEEGAASGRFPRLARFDPPGPVRDFDFEGGLVIRADTSGVRVLRRAGAS